MRCRVCGREGFDICPECQFREQNQQCWRCRMYIPKAEMQQWRGQWICPNCRMDLEREEGEAAGGRKGKEDEGGAAELHEKKGKCDRCGRETLILYKFNGKNLCWYCLEKEDTYSGAGGTGGAIPIQLMREKGKKKGILERIKEYFFGKEPEAVEITSAKVVPVRKREKEGEAVPAKREEGAGTAPGAEERKGMGPAMEKEGKEKKKPEWGEWKKD